MARPHQSTKVLSGTHISAFSLLHLNVTGRLLPRGLCLDAGDEFCVIDKVVEECVPGRGRDARVPEHVFEFIDAVISQGGDGARLQMIEVHNCAHFESRQGAWTYVILEPQRNPAAP
jgi:hypothetical protein